MSKFLNRLQTEQDHNLYTLLAPLALSDDQVGVITVPIGFVSDYATLRGFRNLALFVIYALLVNYGNRAAVVHDYLYSLGATPLTRKEADAVFYRALRADGVARWRAWIFWAGVRIGGAAYYGKES